MKFFSIAFSKLGPLDRRVFLLMTLFIFYINSIPLCLSLIDFKSVTSLLNIATGELLSPLNFEGDIGIQKMQIKNC